MDQSLTLDFQNFQDEKVWDLICEGKTRGVFQAESPLVQKWLKKIQPRNLWELSAVIAIVRPGALESGMADALVDNRNAQEIMSFGHKTVDEIFQSTWGVLMYQEALISLGMRLAWPHEEESTRLLLADTLRKAVGKKNQKKILEIGEKFVKGCETNGVAPELSAKLFEIIKNSGRYLFNLSHSFAYAVKAYELAYLKYHAPKQFYATYLSYAQFKQSQIKKKDELHGKWKEIHDMVNDAQLFNIRVLTPNINKWNYNFAIEGDNIRYGLAHIKYVSKNVLKQAIANADKPQFTHWSDVILFGLTDKFGKSLRSNTLVALISVGAFSEVKESRGSLLSAINFFNNLTPKEFESLQDRIDESKDSKISLKEFKQSLLDDHWIESARKPRQVKIESFFKLWDTECRDTAPWIESQEAYYLGVPISCTRLDEKIGGENLVSECFEHASKGSIKRLHVKIQSIKHTVTKTGKNPGQEMAIIDVADSSGVIKLPVFPTLYAAASNLLVQNALISCEVTRGDKDFFITDIQSLAEKDAVDLEYIE